jgi:hypothetical protein
VPKIPVWTPIYTKTAQLATDLRRIYKYAPLSVYMDIRLQHARQALRFLALPQSEREIGNLLPNNQRQFGTCLRDALRTVPRVGRSCEQFPDGFYLHLLHAPVYSGTPIC